jgi:Fic family protein
MSRIICLIGSRFVASVMVLRYNWEYKAWPKFLYTTKSVEKLLLQISRNEGKYDGIVSMLPKNIQADTIIDLMVTEAMKTSAIEGEYYSRNDVLSSIKKNLGVHQKSFVLDNKNADGISKIMVDVSANFKKPLSKTVLLQWHKMLFPTYNQIQVGKWRTHKEPMQIVSGAMGKTKVHFEAPLSAIVPKEMNDYIQWYNDTAPNGKAPISNSVIRAAVAHLYFESIHPFEDGNGRIGRVLAEKALSQGLQKPILLSLSATIEKNKKQYYQQLQEAQKSLRIQKWIQYFVQVVTEAQQFTEKQILFTIHKAKFYDDYKATLNARQLKAIKKMLDEGAAGFEGGMNATKYKSINKIAKATATRDLQEMLELGALKVSGGGRSTSYSLNLQLE